MESTNSQSLKTKSQGESTTRSSQISTIFHFLKGHTATASMVTEATGVPQKCITRYKRDLEKVGLLYELMKAPCQHTGFLAWYSNTDPEKFPSNNQLTIF